MLWGGVITEIIMSSKTTEYQIGQCWVSEAEPELGLGVVSSVSLQQVELKFAASKQKRIYGRRFAPLKRIRWEIGDHMKCRDGRGFLVEAVHEVNGLYVYSGQGLEVIETDVSPQTKMQGPLGRILSGQWEHATVFDLRQQTLKNWSASQSTPVRGLLGPRVELIPHQVYVVSEVSQRSLPRVLLADEVGLGKTIEAGWIAHQLLTTGRMSRVLVLAPAAMLNQWFVEMRRRFHLGFRVPEAEGDQILMAEDSGDVVDAEGVQASLYEDFVEHDLLILSLESLENRAVRSVLEASQWDLIIVDEAHRVQWSNENPSEAYQTLEVLSKTSRGLLLLTATPEQLGLEGHFGRLRLLDPQRFSSFEDYQKEHSKYGKVLKKVEMLLADDELSKEFDYRDLVDRYGTGRVYIRNSRRAVEADSFRFPERIVKPNELKKSEERLDWLKNLLEQFPRDKFLLISSSRHSIEILEQELRAHCSVKTALFHEGQTLVVRDRCAAYFAEQEGARILLASEIGSEGRNFQFAKHLILWDLPADVDLLEQRMGRLDRIGQGKSFMIHIPYEKGSETETLYRWYHEVFDLFSGPATGANEIHSKYWPVSASKLKAAISKAKKDYLAQKKLLESGRDRLIELNSFHAEKALSLVRLLHKEERAEELQNYMEGIFSWAGVEIEDLDDDSFFVEPGDAMFIPSFPELPDEGARLTFSRKKALSREDLQLLSWDHPMVRQVMDLLVGQEFGSAGIYRWKPQMPGTPRLAPLVEFTYVLRCQTPPEWTVQEFMPPQVIRVVLDLKGVPVTSRWSSEKISQMMSRHKVSREEVEALGLRSQLSPLAVQAEKRAQIESQSLREKGIVALVQGVDGEIERLEDLAEKNGLVSSRELAWWMRRKHVLETAIAQASLQLDSVRVVF